MGRMMIVNASPRAPRSNSKRIIERFQAYWAEAAGLYPTISNRHEQALASLQGCSDLLLVFPLYADSPPSTLLGFLKALSAASISPKPAVHVIINCGFIEPEQNLVALDIIRFFCRQNGFPFGSTLSIGSGEAILDTPFSFLVWRKLKKFAAAVRNRQPVHLQTAMPIPKKWFIAASTNYWIQYGQKNGIDKQQMQTMEIEGGVLPPKQ